MTEKPTILSCQSICQSVLFDVEQVQLRFSNGQHRCFERIRNHTGKTLNSVMALPLIDDDTFLLVREYGVGLERYHIGFPKGLIDPGEEAVAAINREMMEEIHYGSKLITPLITLAPSPAYLDSMMMVFVAKQLYSKELPGDEPEPLEVIPWKIDQVDSLLSHPEFIEARSIAALLYFLKVKHEY